MTVYDPPEDNKRHPNTPFPSPGYGVERVLAIENYLTPPSSGDVDTSRYKINSPGYSLETLLEPEKVVQALAGERLRFQYMSCQELQDVLNKRQKLRDRNQNEIMGQISHVSGLISRCNTGHKAGILAPEISRTLTSLEGSKIDLEKEMRHEDMNLWKDTLELRRSLLDAEQSYRSSKRRSGLFSDIPRYDG